MRRDTVRGFLDALSPQTRKVVLPLRTVVRRTIPQAAESLLWDALSYHRPEKGGRVKGAVCQIAVKRDRVTLEFIHGIRLIDPRGLLQGDRRSKRFIPISTVANARRLGIVDLIRQAASLDPNSWATPT